MGCRRPKFPMLVRPGTHILLQLAPHRVLPHDETASTGPNQGVEDTFYNTNATEVPETKPPTTGVEFSCIDRDPF